MTDTKTRTKLKDKLALKARMDEMDKPIESDKWRNLLFTTSGTSHFGRRIWPTEKSARDYIIQMEKEPWGLIQVVGRTIDFSEYSHTIQMPVKDKT